MLGSGRAISAQSVRGDKQGAIARLGCLRSQAGIERVGRVGQLIADHGVYSQVLSSWNDIIPVLRSSMIGRATDLSRVGSGSRPNHRCIAGHTHE
jgi:hypothetical protein